MEPAETKLNIYQSSTNGFTYEFVDSVGADLDLSTYTKVDAVLMLGDRRNEIKTFSTTVSGNVVSKEFTPAEIVENFKGGKYRFELRFYTDADDYLVFLVLEVNLIDAFRPEGVKEGALVTIKDETTEVTVPDSATYAAQALEAFNKLKIPSGMILVDGQFTNNSGVQYDDVDLAITAARARIADDWDKAVIKAYLDVNGVPIGLGDEDYYDLQDEGVYFESEFDRWDDLVTKGIDVDNEDLLYGIDNDKLKIDLVN